MVVVFLRMGKKRNLDHWEVRKLDRGHLGIPLIWWLARLMLILLGLGKKWVTKKKKWWVCGDQLWKPKHSLRVMLLACGLRRLGSSGWNELRQVYKPTVRAALAEGG